MGSNTSIQIGYVAPGTTAPVTTNISTGNISNQLNAAGGTSSSIGVGNILLATNSASSIEISTGDLNSNVTAALGGSNGIWIGNINSSGGGTVNVSTGNQSVTAVACISGLGCLSQIVGKKNCVMIGNINMAENCGNDSIIEQAIKEIEALGEEVVDGIVVAAKAIENVAEEAWHIISSF